MANRLVLLLATSIIVATAYHGPDLDILKPFCAKSSVNQCCFERQDHCSHPIKDTICYCDQFCKDERRGHDDCCPDYEEVCLGEKPDPQLAPPCTYKGVSYLDNDVRQDNCNNCTCVVNPGEQTGSWRCTRETCITSDDVTTAINARRVGWQAYSYPQFFGKTLRDGVIYKLGTLNLTEQTKRVNPIRPPRRYEARELRSFDSRNEWPSRFISPVRDQGWCGSDWALTLAAIASDRMAIQSKGAEILELSPQLLLSCIPTIYGSCQGGRMDVAYNYARKFGIVEERCLPYNATKLRCQQTKCDRYRVSPLGKLEGEEDVMTDIKNSGPVQAIMKVYQDFFHYRGGIYRHVPGVGNDYITGLHSVRVIGWGEDYGQKYWTVANSWGPEWGEQGYFRILRGANESGIEDFIVTVLPLVKITNQRK